MSAAVSYPGVYIEEIPSGVRTIVGVPTSIAAFVGRTMTGPVDDPIILNSYADYERTFGGLSLDSAVGYAVRDFFVNGGTQAIVVRVYKAGSTDGIARYKLSDGTNAIELKAASPGAWGNKFAPAGAAVGADAPGIVVDNNGITADVAALYGLAVGDLFNLTIQYDPANGGPTEKYLNVTVKPGARQLDQVLAAQSNYLLVDGALPATFSVTAPTKAKVDRAGADSAALGATDYGDEASKTGLYALEKTDIFNLLCIPPDRNSSLDETSDTDPTVLSNALALAVKRRAVLLVDPPNGWSANAATAGQTAKNGFTTDLGELLGPQARNAAVYFPRLRTPDPLLGNRISKFPPCGAMAGIIARTDSTRGVWKAPAGIDATFAAISGFDAPLNDGDSGLLNPIGVNCLRTFPIIGSVVWGARTLRGADQLADDYKYLPVRRLALYIEETLYRGTQWVVFEPNDEPLWAQIRLSVGAFMHDLFRQGAFQGQSPSDAYLVKCDKDTTTQSDINLGVVNVLVGFAPLKPAEFVIIKIQQLAGNVQT